MDERGVYQIGGRLSGAMSRHESAAQRSYRLYLEHTQACPDCSETNCTIAVGLWHAYRDARGTLPTSQ